MAERQDLTGNMYGQLEVLHYAGDDKWHCRCSCGREKDIRTFSLTTSNPRYKIESCGHTRVKQNLELIGKTFGDITVISNAGRGRYLTKCNVCNEEKIISGGDIRRNKGIKCTNNSSYIGKQIGELTIIGFRGQIALCNCSCGNYVEYPLSRILQTQRSCGCLKRRKQIANSLVGKQQGYLKIEELLDNNIYRCKCVCGREIKIRASNLRQGQQSCGCMTSRLHSISIDKNLNRKRTQEQLKAIESKDELEAFMKRNSLSGQISITRLAELLGLDSVSSTAYYIDKFSLRHYILDCNTTSQQEVDILDYIRSITTKDILTHCKKILNGQEIDIYIPELKLAIEYNGSYWHSDINKEMLYHQHKTIECAKKGIRLIHIFGYEWNNQKDKIKNILHNSICNEGETIVYARNTNIAKVEASKANKFFEQYHLQGGTKSSIYIGIYYNEELLGIMSLGVPRFDRKYEYEIHRLCFKPNIRIVGGTNKLFKYFLKRYAPISVLTYVDISKFKGTGYIKIGFRPTSDCITKPNYKWVYRDESEVLTRYQTQKHILVDNGLGDDEDTEYSIMSGLGFYKVYDSGNLKLEWLKEIADG